VIEGKTVKLIQKNKIMIIFIENRD